MNSITVYAGERTTLIESKHYISARYSDNDRVIAVSTIRGLSEFLEKYCLDTENKSSYRNLRVGYITYSKCKTAIDLITKNSQVFLVDNSVNYWDPSKRTYRYFWKRQIYFSDEILLAHLDSRKIALLRSKASGSVPIITIAKGAFDAINRQCAALYWSIPGMPRENGLIECCTLY